MEFEKHEKDGLYKAIYTRRDVRTRYTNESINNKVLAKILDAAHHAPSVGFSQPWNFILVKSKETRLKIKQSFDLELERSSKTVDEPRRSRYLSLKLEGIMDAPVNICVTYDPTRFGPFVIGRSSIPETGVYSVCCAIQNMWLAARAEGIGMGWVSILSNETLRKTLGLPDNILPVAYLCLGYVERFSARPDLEEAGWLPRLKLGDVVDFERWGGKSDPDWSDVAKEISNYA